MSAKFFGQFLIEAGAISSSQLREALDLMESDYEKLGELAVKLGYLRKEDVARLHREQRYVDSPLGELAIERGLMTREQLDELLNRQSDTRLRIGEALVRLGYIEETKIESHFLNFKRSQDLIVEKIRTLPLELSSNRLAEFVVGFFPKITMRIADIRLKIAQGCEAAERHLKDHTASVLISGPEPIEFSLSVDKDFAEGILWGLLGGEIAPEDERPSYEDCLGEYVSIVAGNALMALQEEGVRGRIEPPSYKSGVPTGAFAFVLASTRGTGTLLITPR
ncbi:MAG: hypothetical protein HOI23_15360 [Deltaproteobacteria bacterium]|jgi:hypothetical protein|nr:hypothetical protein [Deltaproteobacteria bacterium]MBT6435771.1 hypothetical protein [Deltaproteobacteria bacterium]MBT6491979.1 hypothetical protein [Deltaproteobacteria bacterium]